jgi:hypothetical protein
LQADIVNISSGEEQARQENLILRTPENPARTVDSLVNLHEPVLETPANLATTIDTLVNLQDLHEPIVTTSAVNSSQEKVRHLSFASSFPCTILIFYLLFRA